MNVFYLDRDPQQAAKYLCDEHILKMGIESAQMLSTAHWLTGSEAPYKKSHVNHPTTKWVRESIQHYRWVISHAEEIFRLYTQFYGKIHKTQQVLEWLKQNEPNIPDNGFVEPPKCMPDEYKEEDTVESYRVFYILDKLICKGLSYKRNKNMPAWIYF